MSNILPNALLKSLKEDFNIEESLFINTHSIAEKVTSVRINPFKRIISYDNEQRVDWCADGRLLKTRPQFIADPLFHAGCYYVQEASSMFLEQVFKQFVELDKSLRVLDLCAAPGGKSTHINSLISKDSLLVSNEIIKTRVNTLSDNLTKWGTLNTIVTNNDPKDFKRAEGYFDTIVVDAPCSGSGMFRKDPKAIQEWSEAGVELCSQRQQRILADIYPALKKDGLLIYSTCSYSKEENEEIADWVCEEFDMESVQVQLNPEWGIEETISDKHKCYGYRFYPHKVRGEGFFIACFRKKEETADIDLFRKDKNWKIDKSVIDMINPWIRNENALIIPVGEGYTLINATQAADLFYLQSMLYLKKAGVRIGKIAGKDLIPDHELAISLLINSRVNTIEVNREEAIRYLRRDEMKLGEQPTTGWAIVTYQGFGLGWVKVLPNRINNYYPKELRILKDL